MHLFPSFLNKLLQNKLIRFFLVSGVNTLFGYGVFALLIFFNIHYSLAVLFSTILGIFFNFKTIGHFVFNNKNNRLLIRFFGVYAIVYVGNVLGLKIFHTFGINDYVGGAILLLPMGLLAFFLNKNLVFNQKVDSPNGR